MATAREDSASAREKTFEVVLRGGKSWGFEVSGGLDEGYPLTLSNIVEDGKAWESGLIDGDVIIRVNDIACLTSHEARQLINSAFRTLTLKLWRSSTTPERLTTRTTSYRKRVEDARNRDVKSDIQDDSVVYDQSKSSQTQGVRMRPRTRRGESFNVKKSSRNHNDQPPPQDSPYQSRSVVNPGQQQYYENQSYRQPSQTSQNSAYRKLASAKSSPSLNNLEVQVDKHGGSISAAKSSPNLKNDVDIEKTYGHVIQKRSESYNSNFERCSLDEPAPALNSSWNLGSGNFKRSYVDQSALRNMHEITDSYDKELKHSKNTRKSLPPYMLQKYQADYENISDYGTTPLRSEKISEIDDFDLDSDNDLPNIQILQSAKRIQPLESPQSPPIPPVRDPSSLKYVKANQSHEKYPSWPVTKPNGSAEQSQPINTRAQSWTDHTNTNKGFPGKQRQVYTTGLRPLPERNSPNSERRGEDGKLRAGSDPGLKSEFVYDKYGRVRQRNYENVDQNQIKMFYESKPGYPPPKLDSDGHNLGDEKYNVPSPPERDVPVMEERERFDENAIINKSVIRPTSFSNQTRTPSRNQLQFSAQSPMNSPIDNKGVQLLSPHFSSDTKPERLMVDSCTSPQLSPKDNKSSGISRSQNNEPTPSSQIKSSTKAYIVKQTPYYNTSTQTDQSPTSSYSPLLTIPKPMPRRTVSDNAAQTSPTSADKNVLNNKLNQNSNNKGTNVDSAAAEKRANYADIKSVSSSRRNSEKPSVSSSANYSDYAALRKNYQDASTYKSIHERYASDIADDDNMNINNIPHYSEYTASQAPILRELSREFYKGRMPANYDKRLTSPQESVRSSCESVQPGMKEAESYSSVIIHASESAGPFGRDDFGSRSSLSDSRNDLYSVVSESASNRSSIAKGRRSMDPSMLSHRPRPLSDQRYNSSSVINHSRTVSSPTSDYRRPRRSSEASTPSQPKSSPDSRSSQSTYYSSSDTSQSRLHDLSSHEHRLESHNDSVFGESRSPLPIESEQAKSEPKEKNVNVNLGRKPSMKKAYGIYDETERVLRGAAATLKAVNEAQNLRRSSDTYAPVTRLSRGSSESKILDQIQEENDVFQDGEGQRSRSSSGKEDSGLKSSDKLKLELFSGENETQKKFGMTRSSSEQISKYSPKSGLEFSEKTGESTPNLTTQSDSSTPYTRVSTTDLHKRNSESDLKKIQHQAVLNFMELKTGKRSSSSGSQDASTNKTGSVTDQMSPTQSVQDLISKTSENLANRSQRTDSFRRSGSSSSSRNSQDYMEMNKPRKETEWSKMRSRGELSYGSDVKSNRSSLCSENTYEDINVFSPLTPRSSIHEKSKDDLEISLLDSFDRNKLTSGMEIDLSSSPTYQNLNRFTSRRRPPPPPPLSSPDDKPPALPPRMYRKPLNGENKTPPANGTEETTAIDNTKIDFKSLMNQWEASPREDSYAADLRRQARRFSEQQPNSTNMSILHSKTKINFSQSYKREPVLVHHTTPPNGTTSHEEQTRVTSPSMEQPMLIEEGNNKENKAPSTPVKQVIIEDEIKTPPRVDRSISELSLPSPPITYGMTLEGVNSDLPPPPPEVLEDVKETDEFADDSYGAYRNKSVRTPGLYKRSVSDANVCLHIENSEHRTDEGFAYSEKKKLGSNSWNSESSLNGAVSQPKRPRDVPCDIPNNVPSFKVESTPRNVIKGSVEPLAAPVNRFANVIPNNPLPYSAQIKQTMPVAVSNGSSRSDSRSQADKESVRNRIKTIEKKGPITKSQTEADRSVAAWLNKNENIPNSPINPGFQPKNIQENLNVQRSRTFNQPRSQVEVNTGLNSGRNFSPHDEIKKRSTFHSPAHYGPRPYQSTYSQANSVTSPETPTQRRSSNWPKDGNKPIPQERVSTNSKQITENSKQRGVEISHNSPTESPQRLNPCASPSRYSGDFTSDRKSDIGDSLSQLRNKGGYSSDKNKQEVYKGDNSRVPSKDSSFVISSNSAKSSPTHNTSLSMTNLNSSSLMVQSNDSSFEKSEKYKSSSSLPPGTICHGRQRSQEELECDQKAKELAKELNENDKTLSEVLVKDSNTKRMQYMDGLFIEPVKPRKLSGDESERKLSREETSPSNKNQFNNDSNRSSLPASYFSSPPKALMEIELRNNEEISRDITKDINDNNGLVKQKEELMEKLHNKSDILRKEKLLLQEEIMDNDHLGEKMKEIVETRCELLSEQEKFKSFIQDQEKIVRLLLNLSGQLARAENAVQGLEASSNPKLKKMTMDKRERLKDKHEEAKLLKENIDKRSHIVSAMLESRLNDDEIDDYNYYIKMKSKLTIDLQELDDRIKLGEEQIQELKKSIPESKPIGQNWDPDQ